MGLFFCFRSVGRAVEEFVDLSGIHGIHS